MAYIGTEPIVGQYRKLDDISGSFNGSTTTFNLTVSTAPVTAGTAQQLLISLGGVIQNPNIDYTVSTNTITFTTAPASGLSFFGVLMGDTLNIGTPSDGTVTSAKLASDLTIDLASGTVSAPSLSFDSNTGFYSTADNEVAITTDGTYRAKVDSSGRLLVGTSTARSNFLNAGLTSKLQIEGTTGTDSWLSVVGNNNSAGGEPILLFGKSRGTTTGSNTVVQSGDILGQIVFQGADGTDFVQAASIGAYSDATPGADDMPGRLAFSTTADGASSPTERMRIDSTGAVLIGKTTSALNTAGMFISSAGEFNIGRNGDVASFNRIATDGTIVRFFQDATEEGTISVSGTTVSYNGAHLSRWSQLPSGAERTEILRGSVLSNIDEMCEWGDEENEQLNRMKISDVEGDKNVSGVFQAWDDDDDTYTDDFYCAMTGDFIIRIAQGVTVERGDLLMSAGDGTAKPQDDDIIRSKTIAKVTSTNVSCTYDDGSYCVPCVLMAC